MTVRTPTIRILNNARGVTPTQLRGLRDALQIQVDRDFAPLWGLRAHLTLERTRGAWNMFLLNDTTQAGLLGYHDMVTAGSPVSFVFVETNQRYSEHWTATASHELLEMLADPDVRRTVSAPYGRRTARYALEVCDPVENDEYAINGVAVSNFITSRWFNPRATGQLDFMRRVRRPLTLSPGGFVGINLNGNWQIVYGRKAPADQKEPSHFARRRRRCPGCNPEAIDAPHNKMLAHD